VSVPVEGNTAKVSATMYSPETFAGSLMLMVFSMLCWGTWANTFSLCRGKYRFELFYWDYAVGVLLGALAWGALLGPGSAMFHGAVASDKAVWGIVAGVVFSIGNVLLVAAISLTGMSVAFPVCIGLALLIGVGLSWYISPVVSVAPLALGSALILLSMIMDAAAYRAMTGPVASSTRGIIIAILGGVFMGAFPPCLQKAMVGEQPLDPYSAVILLGVGTLLCTLVTNPWCMKRPIAGGAPVTFGQYFTAPGRHHALGIVGGIVWASGCVFNFIAGGKVSVAISYAFGTGATLVAVLWGLFVWQEFRGAPRLSFACLAVMFALFLLGIAVIGHAKASM
jgi:glucose uptake protein